MATPATPLHLILLTTLGSQSCPAMASELWLVELEGDDGIRLQFQGAEVERGSAPVWQQGQPYAEALRPGMDLAMLVAQGVATRIEILRARSPGTLSDLPWRRGEGQLLAVEDDSLILTRLGTVTLAPDTRWINGSAADLQPGRELVLTRDEAGRLIEILIANPEEELDEP